MVRTQRGSSQVISLMTVVGLVLINSASVYAACGQPNCVYLPDVARAKPIQVNAYNWGHYGRALVFGFVGDVKSVTTVPLYNVTVSTTFINRSTGVTGTATNTLILPETLPGRLNPFTVVMPSEIWGGPFCCDVKSVSVVSWAMTSTTQYGDVSIESTQSYSIPHTMSGQYPATFVYGIVKNRTNSMLNDVRVVTWSTDQYQLKAESLGNLKIGESATYSITFPNIQVPAGSIKVAAQGVVIP